MSPPTTPSAPVNDTANSEIHVHPYLSPSAQKLLDTTRNSTRKRPFGQKFHSETFRSKLSAACDDKLKYKPHPWQLDVAEALYLGVDTLAIAGTGAGKTLPFALIHLVIPNLVTVVVSPLNALEADQVRVLSYKKFCESCFRNGSSG